MSTPDARRRGVTFDSQTKKDKKLQRYLDASPDIQAARTMYGVTSLTPSIFLEKKTGCKMDGLVEIIQRGEAAAYEEYYKNKKVTPEEPVELWGFERLAKVITGKEVHFDDYRTMEKYCKPESKVLELNKGRRKIMSDEFSKQACNQKNDGLIQLFFQLRPELKKA